MRFIGTLVPRETLRHGQGSTRLREAATGPRFFLSEAALPCFSSTLTPCRRLITIALPPERIRPLRLVLRPSVLIAAAAALSTIATFVARPPRADDESRG